MAFEVSASSWNHDHIIGSLEVFFFSNTGETHWIRFSNISKNEDDEHMAFVHILFYPYKNIESIAVFIFDLSLKNRHDKMFDIQ